MKTHFATRILFFALASLVYAPESGGLRTMAHADDAAEQARSLTALKAPGLVRRTTRRFHKKHAIVGVTVKAVTLQLRARTPLARFVNRSEAVDSKLEFDDFLRQWRRDVKEMARDGARPSGDYSFESSAEITFLNAHKLVCVRHESYRYLGGVHGIENVRSACYGYRAGKPAKLTLPDFFKPGRPYLPLLNIKLMSALKANSSAAWVQDGTLTSITAEQMNNFQAEPDGLRWWFNPYEAGPYAVGFIAVKLKVNELGESFRADSLKK